LGDQNELSRSRTAFALELSRLDPSHTDLPSSGRRRPLSGEPLYAYADSTAALAINAVLRQRVINIATEDPSGGQTVSQTYVGAEVLGTLADRIGFRVRHYEAREWSTLARASRDDVLARPLESVQLKGQTVDFRAADVELAATLPGLPWLRLDAGKTAHQWGPSLTGSPESLFLSSGAPSFGSARIHARYGRLSYVHLIGFLRARDGLIDSSRTRIENGHLRTFLRPKRFAAHRLEIQLGRLLLGLQESVVYADRGTEFLYALPATVLTPVQSYLDDTDNLMIGMDITAVLKKGVRLHAGAVLDDLKKFSPGAFSNKLGLQFGVSVVDPFGLQGADVNAEFVHLEPYLYSHNFHINTYEHFGELLGHSLGPNADAVHIDGGYRFTAAWRVTASLGREREGENPTSSGTGIRNVGGSAFQGRRPGDTPERNFLDGDVVTRLKTNAGLIWSPARDVVLEFSYQTTSHRNTLLSTGLRGDFRTHRWSVTLDYNYQ